MLRMNKQLAFAALTVKSYDDEKREFSGIATTPTPDRVRDIVEPSGAVFTLPLPLLAGHKQDRPIGEVYEARVTRSGIEYKARIPRVEEEGAFRDRVDTAWQEIKYGVVRGVSIGFLAEKKDTEPLLGGGTRFKRWLWTELSAVAIPAQAEATIAQIKSAYAAEGDGIGAPASSPVIHSGEAIIPARAVSKSTPVVKLAQAKGTKMSKLNESLKGYEDALAAKKAERTATVMKSLDEGRTADAAEQETIDTLGGEIKELEKQITLVKGLIESDLATAKAVTGSEERKPGPVITVQANHAPDGMGLAQLVRFMHHSKGVPGIALGMAEAQKQSIDPRVLQIIKAAVSAGSTGVAAWAGNLVTPGGIYADFVEFLRPQTLLGRFGRDGVPSLRTVPFGIPLLGQTSGGAGYWVGEGNAKPLTKFDFSQTKLDPLKVAAITAVTKELLDRSGPAADALLRDQLVEALRGRLDTDFINPAKTAVAGISPASITNGVVAIPSVGSDAAAIRADVAAVLGAYAAANNPPSSGVWVMSTTLALQLSMMQTPLGSSEFPQLTMRGGVFLGFPVVVSDYVPAETVVFLNASDVYVGDEGGFLVDASDQVALEMADNPAHSSVTPTGSNSLVSMWQTNSVAFRAERIINWSKRRPTAVQVLTGVKWGEYVPPVGP